MGGFACEFTLRCPLDLRRLSDGFFNGRADDCGDGSGRLRKCGKCHVWCHALNPQLAPDP